MPFIIGIFFPTRTTTPRLVKYRIRVSPRNNNSLPEKEKNHLWATSLIPPLRVGECTRTYAALLMMSRRRIFCRSRGGKRVSGRRRGRQKHNGNSDPETIEDARHYMSRVHTRVYGVRVVTQGLFLYLYASSFLNYGGAQVYGAQIPRVDIFLGASDSSTTFEP